MYREPTVERRKLELKSMIWNRRKKKTFNRNKETRIQKNEERLRNLWDNVKCSNIRIIGMPEVKRKNKKLKSYLKKIMKENFPNRKRKFPWQRK